MIKFFTDACNHGNGQIRGTFSAILVALFFGYALARCVLGV